MNMIEFMLLAFIAGAGLGHLLIWWLDGWHK